MVSHRQLATWYHTLGQTLDAGLPLLAALENPAGPRLDRRTEMARRLRAGDPLNLVLAGESAWLPEVDIHLLTAGAGSGRLPASCRQLAAHHESVGRLTRRALLAALYPLAILHLAAFLLPLPRLVSDSFFGYAQQVALTLIPLWLLLGLIAVPLLRHAGFRRRVFAWLPGVAGYQRARDLAVLATVLEGYVSAGVGLDLVWPAAGRATGAPALASLGIRLGAEAAAGRRPGVLLSQLRVVPEEFVQLYRSGEDSGRLDESLVWFARRSTEQAERSLTLVTIWYPQVALLAVGAVVAFSVIRSYAAYLNELLKIME